jgi:hypothetical protein
VYFCPPQCPILLQRDFTSAFLNLPSSDYTTLPTLMPRTYYVLKVKGKAKIPDYIQVRDAAFTLVGYFRPGRGGKTGGKTELDDALYAAIEASAETIPFGIITPLEL